MSEESKEFNLNKLIDFARMEGISFVCRYSESCDELEIQTISPAESECVYMKRVHSVEDFIDFYYRENIK